MSYQPAIVTFMDLLGFARQVQSGLSAGAVDAMLDKVEAEFKKGAHDDAVSVCVSDCVIRALPTKSTSRIEIQEIALECIIIGIAQCRLVQQGLPVRGAITCGDVSLQPSRFFGPAYQTAYCLERNLAKVPRIIIDRSLVSRLYDPMMLRPHTKDEILADFGGVAAQDEDGQWFIDYLYVHSENADAPEDVLSFLSLHRKVVAESIDRHRDDGPVLSKYEWMKKYHNRHVETLSPESLAEYDVTKASLRIS